MKNLPDIKIGLVAGSTDWMSVDLAASLRGRLSETFKSMSGEADFYECPIVITDNEVSVKRASKDIGRAECDAICVYYANYGPESAGTLFAREFDGPVMFIAAAEEGEEPFLMERKDAMSGFINACYALKLRGTNVYIPANPVGTLVQCAEMISQFYSIARTIVAVKDLKVISFGPRPSSYLAACAPDHTLYELGIEVSVYSELELFDSYNRHASDTRIDKVIAEMTAELGEMGNKYPSQLAKFAQYELTVEDWVRNHKGNRKNVTLTSTCWPAFPVNFGFVPCYVNSRITGKGIPVACEVDVYGAVSEYIGQCVSNDVVAILNINNNLPQSVFDSQIKGKSFNGKSYAQEDLFIGYHCGVTSSSKLTSCSSELHFVNHHLIGEEQSTGTLHGQVIPGAITLFRIQADRAGHLQAYIAQGQVLPVTMKTYGGFGIIAIPEMRRFFRNVVLDKQFPNHAAVVFGHYGEELFSILRYLGIDDIEYNHPKDIPYRHENVFHSYRNWY